VAVAVSPPAHLRARLRPSAIPRPLAGLLAACALLSIAWTITMAPLQGPDEHNHLGYVQQLAETGSGPSFGATTGASWSREQQTWMGWQSLLSLIGISDARPGWNPAEEARLSAYEDHLPSGARKDGSGPNPVGQNPPLYYAYETIPYWISRWSDLPTRLLFMRLANVPLYLAIVVFAWLAAGEAFGRRRRAQTMAAGSVGLLPQLTFMSGVVNPDILLATVWAALAYVSLVAVRAGPRPRVLVSLGAVAAASVLTHGRGLAVIIPLLVVLAVMLWRARPLSLRTLAWMGGALATLAVGLIVAVAYSSAHGGGSSISGEVGSTTGAGSVKGFISYLWEFYLPRLRTMTQQGPPYGYRQVFIEGLGGTFGSLEIQYPLWVYDALQVAAGAGLALLGATIVRRWETVRANWAKVVVVAAIPFGMLAVLHVSAYRDLQSPPFDPLLVGRYLLPLVVAMGLAIAWVCISLPRRWGTLLGALVLTLFTVLSLSGLGLTIARFYA
jgi:4-amino-4-deoxy-L-arabinose transferase-like glycosyltransferase